jgi:mRNA-degrading endonuclease RelE of RelBE toxin-antitoxin system
MSEIFFRPRALKGFKSANKKDQGRIQNAIEILKKGTFPTDTKKLASHRSGYRIRVGRWRILFVISKSEIDVVDIFIKKSKSDYN